MENCGTGEVEDCDVEVEGWMEAESNEEVEVVDNGGGGVEVDDVMEGQ
jgi:hypothetical protein